MSLEWHVVALDPKARSQMTLELPQLRQNLVFRAGVGSEAWAECCTFEAGRKQYVPYELVRALGAELADLSVVSAEAWTRWVAQIEHGDPGHDVDWQRLSVSSWNVLVAWAAARMPTQTKLLQLTATQVQQLQGEGFVIRGPHVPKAPKAQPADEAVELEVPPLPPGFAVDSDAAETVEEGQP
ncbi:MAG: hypothetical protein AAFX50_22505 [Acidobacteriota bacterium]